jgi:hypothetical protein
MCTVHIRIPHIFGLNMHKPERRTKGVNLWAYAPFRFNGRAGHNYVITLSGQNLSKTR